MNAQDIANYVRQAKLHIGAGDYKKAQECVIHAAEVALLLAKRSVGREQEGYLSQYKSLKAMLGDLSKKAAAKQDAPSAPEPPAFGGTDAKSPRVGGSSAPEQPQPSLRTPSLQGKKAEPEERTGWKKPQGNSLSPQWLSDYIGQPQAVAAVKDLIDAAKLRNSALPHIIMYGSHGLGKSTFSRIIANEMRANFVEINGSQINIQDLINIFKNIKPRDIVFIDEIHTIPLAVAESVLYSAMQDGKITYTEGKKQNAHSVTVTLPPFTLIGATTEIGKLAKPFTQRAIQIRLEEYTDEVLSRIITNSFFRLGMKITGENALYIAMRCRNNTRIANNMVKRISDKALVRYAAQNNVKGSGVFDSVDAIRELGISVEKPVIDSFFEENGIDEWGLEKGDRDLLSIIIKRYNGGPVGLDTLARAMNESNNVISQKYEAYLIKKGLMRIDRDGRCAMPIAYKAVGLPVPVSGTGEQKPSEEPQEDDGKPKSKYEKRKVVASKVQDELRCAKIENLIVYPENAVTFEGNLDELFSDVQKPMEGETRHFCELEIDFDTHKRVVECDSFLESRFATCMAETGYILDLRAQTLEVDYVSQALSSKRYFPDFVIRDYKNRIAVLEMKNFDMVSYHLNIDKYEMLRKYCESKGYGYAEIMKPNGHDSGYVTAEMLENAPVNHQLESVIFERLEKNAREQGEAVFTEADFREYCEVYGETDRRELYTVLLNNRKLKNIDRVGNDLKIVPNE